MPEARLHIDIRLPFSCQPQAVPANAAALLPGARFYLKALNQMEAVPGHAERSEPGLERLEAKLDLMLHWLGHSLFGSQTVPGQVMLSLDAEGVEWHGDGVSPGQAVSLSLYLSGALSGPLQLPAMVVAGPEGGNRAEFVGMDEELRDLWSQWLFRRHRRAIHAAREGG